MQKTTMPRLQKASAPLPDDQTPELHTAPSSPSYLPRSEAEDDQIAETGQEARPILDVDCDPFSTETSKILFDAIGMSITKKV
jgi:hypothetical protein